MLTCFDVDFYVDINNIFEQELKYGKEIIYCNAMMQFDRSNSNSGVPHTPFVLFLFVLCCSTHQFTQSGDMAVETFSTAISSL